MRFELRAADLSFHDAALQRVTEPGQFHLWIGPDSTGGLQGSFEVVE